MSNYNWFLVFSSSEKALSLIPPNGLIRIDVEGREMCLAHKKDGFVAFLNKCPHQGIAFHKGGFLEGNTVVCPWHRYSFNLNTGREVEKRCDQLEIFPVEIRSNGIFVGIPKKDSFLKRLFG